SVPPAPATNSMPRRRFVDLTGPFIAASVRAPRRHFSGTCHACGHDWRYWHVLLRRAPGPPRAARRGGHPGPAERRAEDARLVGVLQDTPRGRRHGDPARRGRPRDRRLPPEGGEPHGVRRPPRRPLGPARRAEAG